ncbi:MAG: hypothetical protein NVS2B8_00140 [Vulcanimicrobiaceae bacterium]
MRADPNQSGRDRGAREGGVFCKESVARMDGIRAAPACRFEDSLDVEVTLRGHRRSE